MESIDLQSICAISSLVCPCAEYLIISFSISVSFIVSSDVQWRFPSEYLNCMFEPFLCMIMLSCDARDESVIVQSDSHILPFRISKGAKVWLIR